jgi:hypothetical protein
MIGPKFLKVGARGFMSVLANDGSFSAPPPIPIVHAETDMIRALQAEFAAVERQDKTCCLVIVKPEAAEAGVVAAVGERFSRSLRPYDGLFAFGTGRYLISLPHIKLEDTVTVMDRLRGRIADHPFEVEGKSPILVPASLGGAMIEAALPLQDNIARANQALNVALAGGGNQVCIWSSDLDVA